MSGKWTQFWDMSSGGGQKLDWGLIFIEAPLDQAVRVFQNRFGRNPYRVTCTCCGADYSVDEANSLEEATAYFRKCEWRGKGYDLSTGIPLAKYLSDGAEYKGIPLVIRAEEIKSEELQGELRREGYVWAEDDD
jgi:hypothetical protein